MKYNEFKKVNRFSNNTTAVVDTALTMENESNKTFETKF